MKNSKQTVGDVMGTLAEDARALMAATSGVAGEKVSEARQRLAAALERGKGVYGQARDKALDRAKATDQLLRDNPYQALAVALGIGVIVGLFVATSCAAKNDQ
jgi:ElaB/YqjD/DUF883 family membrane-anchored ribosome-binding protein